MHPTVSRRKTATLKKVSKTTARGIDPRRDARPVQGITYQPASGIDDFVDQISRATPAVLIATERQGVTGDFLRDLSKKMELPAVRVFSMLGIPKATGEKWATTGSLVTGAGGFAMIGVAKLLGIVKTLIAISTAPEAGEFNSSKWLGAWLEQPQPALGGKRPADMIDTPTGLEVVTRLLGAIQSGTYQ